jgi:rod shape-determining protein MreB
MLIGEPTAESVKIELACALPEERPRSMEVRGRDLVSGIPRGTTLRSDEIARAIHEPIQAIVAAVVRTLEATPPELASDIVDEGITLTGGGSLIRGLDELIRQRTGVPVRVAEDPLTAVVRGTAAILEDFDRHRDLLRV